MVTYGTYIFLAKGQRMISSNKTMMRTCKYGYQSKAWFLLRKKNPEVENCFLSATGKVD